MKWVNADTFEGYLTDERKIAVNTLIVLSSLMLLVKMVYPHCIYYLGLNPQKVFKSLWLWQLVTYQFLHGGFFHLFFNMFALWVFGRQLEQLWGSSRFLLYYLTCGIGAGIASVFLSGQLTIGASGSIYGLLLAFGLIFPDQYLLLYFLFPIKARTLVIIFAVLEFVMSLQSPGDHIAHSAHLAGMFVGLVYLKIWQLIIYHKNRNQIARFNKMLEREKELEQELDRILSKIKEFGIESLTRTERRFLDEASEYYKYKSRSIDNF